VQHLRISQGSLKELETHLLLAERVGILPVLDLQSALTQCESLGKMLRALIRSLQDKSAK
jgi:four helix bundle protein